MGREGASLPLALLRPTRRSPSALLSSPQEQQRLARVAPTEAIGRCWVSKMLSGRAQALQSFVASWRAGIGFGSRLSPAGGRVDTRSVAATFGMFLEIREVVVGKRTGLSFRGLRCVRMRGGRMTSAEANRHHSRARSGSGPLLTLDHTTFPTFLEQHQYEGAQRQVALSLCCNASEHRLNDGARLKLRN